MQKYKNKAQNSPCIIWALMASLEHDPIRRRSDWIRTRVRPQVHLLGQLGTMSDKDTLHFTDLMKSGSEHNTPDPNPLQTHWGHQRIVN